MSVCRDSIIHNTCQLMSSRQSPAYSTSARKLEIIIIGKQFRRDCSYSKQYVELTRSTFARVTICDFRNKSSAGAKQSRILNKREIIEKKKMLSAIKRYSSKIAPRLLDQADRVVPPTGSLRHKMSYFWKFSIFMSFIIIIIIFV